MTPEETHQHSKVTLDHLSQYDDYLESITNICDMGAGIGHDACYIGDLKKPDGRPYNFQITAVDRNYANIKTHPKVIWKFGDLHNIQLEQQDFIWCHNVLQYLRSPIDALFHWHSLLRVDGLLIVEIPIMNIVLQSHGKFNVNSICRSGYYHNYNLSNLIIQLTSAGFDCRGGHFQLDKENGWIRAAVYKTEAQPKLFDSLYELADTQRLPFSLDKILNQNDTFCDNDLVVEWIDRTQSFLSL